MKNHTNILTLALKAIDVIVDHRALGKEVNQRLGRARNGDEDEEWLATATAVMIEALNEAIAISTPKTTN